MRKNSPPKKRSEITLEDIYLYEAGYIKDNDGTIRTITMHKKIMQKAAKALEKDAKHYAAEAKHAKGKHKKEEMVERKEAKSAAKDLKKRAKKAHEY